MNNKTIKVVSRDSQLALWQTNYAIEQLKPYFPDTNFEVVSLKTKGDKILDVSLSKIGDKGLFTNELEAKMLSGEVDLAVHSLKDMPTEIPDGLKLSCYLKRYDHRDAFLTKHGGTIEDLPMNATVGTSSLRRKAQLLSMRPDLNVQDLRGNVNTRLKKYHEENFDAVLLAVAGLERLNFHDEINERLDDRYFVPAVGQGALVIESRSDRKDLLEKFALLNDENTYRCVTAERDFMCALDGGCQVPMGAYASIANEMISIHGFVGMVDGSKLIKDEVSVPVNEYKKVGKLLADCLIAQGANDILSCVR